MYINSSKKKNPSNFTSFSPSPLSPPQIFHKRASSFDPNVIQRTSPYTSADSLNLHSSQSSFGCLFENFEILSGDRPFLNNIDLHVLTTLILQVWYRIHVIRGESDVIKRETIGYLTNVAF